MATRYEHDQPERTLMSVLSDLLGIAHFTTSSGGTVRTDFLLAVAGGLGVPPERLSGRLKDEVLAACVEAATHEPMDEGLFSPGATVTNAALQRIVDGIMAHGVAGRPALPDPAPAAAADPAGEDAESDPFDPADVQDERDRRLLEIAVRQGRDTFRAAVLEAYGNTCAVTAFDAVDALQAAHIYPYRGPATNLVSNGLCLRADIHALYDRGALSVHETSFEVLLKPHLMVTRYAELSGATLRLPHRVSNRPSTAALRSHREWAGLG